MELSEKKKLTRQEYTEHAQHSATDGRFVDHEHTKASTEVENRSWQRLNQAELVATSARTDSVAARESPTQRATRNHEEKPYSQRLNQQESILQDMTYVPSRIHSVSL
jgi:hypothetical protein